MSRKDFHINTTTLLSHRPVNRASRGFTIVEVLVSIIIFSIGLIGVARLQVVAKQSNHDAVQRVTATGVAQDILTRMRANQTELETYVSNSGSTTIGGVTISSEPSPSCAASGTSCTSAQLASHDLWDIEQAVDGVTEQAGGNNTGGLVSPTLCITGLATGVSGVYTVAIAWRGKAALTNSTRTTCGNASGLYGTNSVYRRVLVMETFITSI
jgi:type IV pilus assembly protein PilV